MKRLLFVTTVLAAAHLAFPRAQGQSGMFTRGTPAEVALARSMGLERLRASALQRGIADELAVSSVTVDPISMAHTRVQQRHRGIPVFGGEAIAHSRPNGELFAETDDLVPNVLVDTAPALTTAAAIRIATNEYGCTDCLTAAPLADLWVLRSDD